MNTGVSYRATLSFVIKSIRHAGLRKFYETGSKAGINPQHADRLRMQLATLATAATVDDINLPGYDFHAPTGDKAGRWAISVNKNWGLTFEITGDDIENLDYEDYH